MVSPIAVYCGSCGYDLRGSTSSKCPECGVTIVLGGIGHGSWRPEWRWHFVVTRLIGAQILIWGTIPFIPDHYDSALIAMVCGTAVGVAVIHNVLSLPAPIVALVSRRSSDAAALAMSVPIGLGLLAAQGMTVIAAAILRSYLL